MPQATRSARPARTGFLTIAGLILLFVTAPLWLLLLVAVLSLYLTGIALLYVVVWSWWIGRARRRVLFVYSDSPNWKQYIEDRILPRLPANAVVLNWSQHAQWSRVSLAVVLFKAFSSERDFNPIALVFGRFARVEHVRFRRAFRDAKHGKGESLRAAEAELLRRLDQ
jgi:hypothetical protein